MYILSKLSSLVIAGAMSLGLISAPVQTNIPADLSNNIYVNELQVGTAVPSTPALYDGYLNSNILNTDTTMTVNPGTLRNGTTLSGYMCFVVDVNQPTTEYICGTASGQTISNLSRGVDVLNPNATSSAYAFGHRRFASVAVSDYPTIQFLVRKMNGTDSLDTPLSYSFASTSITSPYHLADKEYVDGVAFNGAGVINASTIAKGVVELATTLESASSTATGSTGATLVIPASSATSTYNSATAPLRVVVTQNNGKIDGNFIATSTLFVNSTLTGTTTLTSTSTTYIGSFPAYNIGKNIQVITTTGTSTFAVPSGVSKIFVRLVGAGGGSAPITAGGANQSCTNGAGAGGYSQEMIDVTGTTSITVYVAPAPAANTAGAWTTFGVNGFYLYANGGAISSTGGTASGGDVNIQGGYGGTRLVPVGNSGDIMSGYGGASMFSGSTAGSSFTYSASANNGGNGLNYGGGASGACAGQSQTGNGASGAQGIIIITW